MRTEIGHTDNRFTAEERDLINALSVRDDDDDLFLGSEQRFFAAPASVSALATLYAAHPDAVLVAGATRVGVWITDKLDTLPKIIWLGRVRGLDEIEDAPHAVTFGAMVSHESAIEHLAAIDPDLGELMRRFGGTHASSVGTIGGNIANSSPISDTPAVLIALGATVSLQSGAWQRSLALETFFNARTQNRAAEFVRSVRVPKLKWNERFRCFKISPRSDRDISAAVGAFRLTLCGLRIQAARIAFGGISATPRRASHAEVALAGANLADDTSWVPALTAIATDFIPISDQHGSADYRRDAAQALLYKALIEIGSTPTQHSRIGRAAETADAGYPSSG